MSEKISLYTPIGRTPIDTDLMDSSIDLGGGVYSSRKVLLSEMKEYFKSYTWYEEGTVQPPTSINTDIYTGGNVGVSMGNTDVISAKLHVKQDSIDDIAKFGDNVDVKEEGTIVTRNKIIQQADINTSISSITSVKAITNCVAYYATSPSILSDNIHFEFQNDAFTQYVMDVRGVAPSITVDIKIYFTFYKVGATKLIVGKKIVDNSSTAMLNVDVYISSSGYPTVKILPITIGNSLSPSSGETTILSFDMRYLTTDVLYDVSDITVTKQNSDL